MTTQKEQKDLHPADIVHFRLTWETGAILLVICIIFNAFFLFAAWGRYKDAASSEAVTLAQSLETLLQPEYVAELTGGVEDLEKTEYIATKNRLSQLVQTTGHIKFAYLMGIKGNDLVFLVDSESPDSQGYSPPGQVYNDAKDVVLDVFQTGETVMAGPTKDSWGTWYNALVPVKDPNSGQIIAVFGLDFPASEWRIDLWTQMVREISISVLFIFFIFALYLAAYHYLKLKELSDKTAINEALYRSVFEQVPIGIAVVNDKSFATQAEFGSANMNPEYENILGRSSHELSNISWPEITHPDDLHIDLDEFEKFQTGENDGYTMQKRFLKPDGSYVWTYMTVTHFLDKLKDNPMHLCLLSDITEEKESENKLLYNYEHDSLTGLYNRDYFNKILAKDQKDHLLEKRALVGVNLNTLQSLSSMYGLQYTQELIQKIAVVLSQFSAEDRILTYTYENRFVLYVRNYKDEDELKELSQKIAETLEPILSVERVGGGIGIVELNPDEEIDLNKISKTMTVVSEKAIDLKENGIGICCYDDNIEMQMAREEVIIRELNDIAASEEDGGLYLQYQPILDLKTNGICGFEALARLNTENLGRVMPLEFIHIAEKTKLIVPIGWKIVRQAFGFINRLKGLGYDKTIISINFSVIQLMKDDFVDSLLNMINGMQVNPENICIEITESVFSSGYDDINMIMSRLRNYGLTVAIDDFGTGYSSLSREHELIIDSVKIDKLFIDKLLTISHVNAITSDIISIAHKLGQSTVAEGVEYEEQKQYLLDNGCNKIQGYLIGYPLDEVDAIALLEAQAIAVSLSEPV